MKNIFKWGLMLLFSSVLSANAGEVHALADETTHVTQMMSMSLEDLLTMKITPAAEHEQGLEDVTNAMYVTTKEDIKKISNRKGKR